MDGQLLIAAQATSDRANALYGAAALDLPRRGVVHLPGGMGTIAAALVAAVRAHGGRVLLRHEVRAARRSAAPGGIDTPRGTFEADALVCNLPPANAARLLGPTRRHVRPPRRLRRRTAGAHSRCTSAWTARRCGRRAAAPPGDRAQPMAEGNSVFLSLSPVWDMERAPAGDRVATLGTAHAPDRVVGPVRARPRRLRSAQGGLHPAVLAAAELAVPGLRAATRLVLPGTPVSFQRFTRRDHGWVGGFPQTDLARTWAPRLAPGLWLVGDSIFPGQSTAAVALGGLRVAADVLAARPARRATPERR